MNKAISVIGLGKLGLPLALVFCSKGYRVIGVDINKERLDEIKKLIAPDPETDIQEYLTRYGHLLIPTTDYSLAIKNSDITFILVPTPSHKDGSYNLDYVKSAIKLIGKELKDKTRKHLVVLSSTVIPTDCSNELLPLLVNTSNKKPGFCYNPFFIAQGSVIRDFLHPQLVLIGESDKNAGDMLEKFWKDIFTYKTYYVSPVFKRMSLVNAEITKLAFNTFSTMKISFMNLLSELCEQVPTGDVDTVTDALKVDDRITKKLFKGGLGYGGNCLPRDNAALEYFCKKLGTTSRLGKGADIINKRQVWRVLEIVHDTANKYGITKIGILGLSFKPNTYLVIESQQLQIADYIAESYDVMAYDPMAIVDRKYRVDSMGEVLDTCDMIVILTPWDEFKGLVDDDFTENHVVIDCWRILGDSVRKKVRKYIGVGLYRGHVVKNTF